MDMDRASKIETAIQQQKLPVFEGRHVGQPCQLARLAEVAQSTVRYAQACGNVRKYELMGATLLLDAQDLADHFRVSRPGRKPIRA